MDIVMYRWSYHCPIRGKRMVTRHHATEEQVRVEHPDAEVVPGSQKVVHVPDDPMANCTSRILDGYTPPFDMRLVTSPLEKQ